MLGAFTLDINSSSSPVVAPETESFSPVVDELMLDLSNVDSSEGQPPEVGLLAEAAA